MGYKHAMIGNNAHLRHAQWLNLSGQHWSIKSEARSVIIGNGAEFNGNRSISRLKIKFLVTKLLPQIMQV